MDKRPKKHSIEHVLNLAEFRQNIDQMGEQMQSVYQELEELQVLTAKLLDVGVAISSEIDLYSLLTRIIDEAKKLLKADRGTLYLVDEDKSELYFHVTDEAKIKEVRIPIDKRSISGYVALSRNQLNIPDVYRISKSKPYFFNKDVDSKYGYRTKSMLTVPMINHEGRVTGAVQLINKTIHGEVIPFSERDQRILMSLASQAAVAIENAQLYREVAELFESLVQYSASAIDERDPATAGHSRRVALYSSALARAMNVFSEQEIKELEYAAWLHDVGKIGVREHILIKENKLYPHQMGKVRERFKAAKLSIEASYMKSKLELFQRGASAAKLRALDDKIVADIKYVDDALAFIEKINKPGFMSDDDLKRLQEIASQTFTDFEGGVNNLLTDEESLALSVRRGNLTDSERKIMNAHVDSTFKILCQIPFTQGLKNVPKFAAAHHEKLDGSGYPHNFRKKEIPLQARILALVDIYDALTAQDRPYKPAMPVDKAISILEADVKENRLDPEVFNTFIKHKIYELEDPGAASSLNFHMSLFAKPAVKQNTKTATRNTARKN